MYTLCNYGFPPRCRRETRLNSPMCTLALIEQRVNVITGVITDDQVLKHRNESQYLGSSSCLTVQSFCQTVNLSSRQTLTGVILVCSLPKQIFKQRMPFFQNIASQQYNAPQYITKCAGPLPTSNIYLQTYTLCRPCVWSALCKNMHCSEICSAHICTCHQIFIALVKCPRQWVHSGCRALTPSLKVENGPCYRQIRTISKNYKRQLLQK